MTGRLVLVSLRGADPADAVAAAVACGWLPDTAPHEVGAPDLSMGPPHGDWTASFAAAADHAFARWGDDATAAHSRGVTVLGRAVDPVATSVVDILAALPFQEATVTGLHPEWADPPTAYRAPSLGGGMPPHGWLCAFRGDGHDRLVSRRWLGAGPWLLHERPGDLSVLQLHDEDADSATALAQARPAHDRLGLTDRGGYVGPGLLHTSLPRGSVDPRTGLMKVVVHGRPVTETELLEVCSLRGRDDVDPGPVRNAAYVFIEEPEARVHLDALWLRGLECHTFRRGVEVRLDALHHVDPVRPDWA